MDSLASGFAGVDKTEDAHSFVQYLDLIHSIPFFRECKKQSYQKLGITLGASVLEIGCGNGVDAKILSGIVGSSGEVIGIDVSSTMLTEACKNKMHGDCFPEFLLCDATNLAFADDSFDAIRTDRVIQHTRDPFAVVREMARVAKPSGKIVAFEPDWGTYLLWPGKKELTRKFMNFWCDRIPYGLVGRSLYAAFAAAGLKEIEITPLCLTLTDLSVADRVFSLEDTRTQAVNAGILDCKEAECWAEEQNRADAAGEFFSSLTFYMVTGRKEE